MRQELVTFRGQLGLTTNLARDGRCLADATTLFGLVLRESQKDYSLEKLVLSLS